MRRDARTGMALFLAVSMIVALGTVASARTFRHTLSLDNYGITYKTQNEQAAIRVSESTADAPYHVIIENGGVKDTVNITLLKGATAPADVEIDAVTTSGSAANQSSFRNFQTVAPINLLKADDGQIRKLTAKKTWVGEVVAKEIGAIKMNPEPNSSSITSPVVRLTSTLAHGGFIGTKPLAAKGAYTGLFLTNWSTADQVVTSISVNSKKNRDKVAKQNYISYAGIEAPQTVQPIDETEYDVNIIGKELRKVTVKGASINANEIMGGAGKNSSIAGTASIFSKIGSTNATVGRAADLKAQSLLSGANSLSVNAKGGTVDIESVVAEFGIKTVQATYRIYKDELGERWTLGGYVGDISEAPAVPTVISETPYSWPGQMLISSGVSETIATKPSRDINKVHGDLGVFAGMFAASDMDESDNVTNSRARVRKVSVRGKLSKHISESVAAEQRVQGFAYTSQEPKPTSKKLPFDPAIFVSGVADPLIP